MAPQLRPILRWACAAYGFCIPTPTSGVGAQSMPAASVAPMALVASLRPRIPAYQGAQVAAVGGYVAPRVVGFGGVLRLRETLWRRWGTGSTSPRLCRLRLRR